MTRDDEPADPFPPPSARATTGPRPCPPAAEPGRQLAEALARARHLNDLLVAMREVTALLRHERDRQRLLDGVCGCLVRTRGYVAVWIGEPDDATGEVRSVAYAGTGSGFQAHAPIRWDEGPLGQGPTGTALRERRPVVFDDLALDPRFAPWRGPVLAAGAASIASVPLLHQGAPLGVVTVKASRASAFDAEEVELLRGLAEEVGHALQALEDERALRESEETLRTVFESSPIGLEIFDRDGLLVRCNRKVSELFGMDESAYLGRFRLRDDPNYQAPDVWARLDRGEEVRHRAAFDFGKALYPSTKSGLAFHDVTTTPVPASVSSRIGYVMQIVDVTEARRAEDRRRASDERYRLLFERSHDGILTLEPPGWRFTSANPAAAAIFGAASTAALLARGPWELSPERQPDGTVSAESALRRVEEALAEGFCYFDWTHRRLGGEEFVADVLLTRVDQDGTPVLQATVRDVTARRRSEAELERYRTRLEELVAERTAELAAANRELEAFSYSVSHDLRAPIRAIDGFAELLRGEHGDRLGAEGQRLLGVVRENSQIMGRLVDALLRLSRVGRKELERTEVDMDGLVRSVVAALAPSAETRAEVVRGELPRATGDPELLRQVWVNLLSNALKFSATRAAPRVEIGGLRQGDAVRYWVEDNGVGFDPDHAGKLFGVFQRLHAQKEFPGTGVGLALVHRVVTRLGGKVWAEGAVDGGATFSFSLPAARGEG